MTTFSINVPMGSVRPTYALASLKLWLEHGIAGDLMYDKFPDAAYADR